MPHNFGGMLGVLENFAKDVSKRGEIGTKVVTNAAFNFTLDRVPVDQGLLKASGRADIIPQSGGGLDTIGEVSYGMEYGVYVHEDPDKAHGAEYNAKYAHEIATGTIDHRTGRPYKSRGELQQYKFIEVAFTDPGNRQEMHELMKEELAD